MRPIKPIVSGLLLSLLSCAAIGKEPSGLHKCLEVSSSEKSDHPARKWIVGANLGLDDNGNVNIMDELGDAWQFTCKLGPVWSCPDKPGGTPGWNVTFDTDRLELNVSQPEDSWVKLQCQSFDPFQ